MLAAPRGIAAASLAVFGAKVTLRGVQHSERLWPARLRWRMRGAWLWPAFFGLTVVDGVLIAVLPPYDGTPPGLVGGRPARGLREPDPARRRRAARGPRAAAAAAGPAASDRARLRRRGADRARLTAVLLVAGLAHRPAIAAERADDAASVAGAVRGYVGAHAAEWRGGLAGVDVRD